MTIKNILKVVGIIVLGFVLIQLIPYGRNHTNPPVVAEPKWDSPQTRELAKRACMDCHSNETVWPWYSVIAPGSWLIQKDVDEAREIFNLSNWQGISGNNQARERADAKEINEVITRGSMPPNKYLILHPNAALSQSERTQLAAGLLKSLGFSK